MPWEFDDRAIFCWCDCCNIHVFDGGGYWKWEGRGGYSCYEGQTPNLICADCYREC